MIRLCHSQGTLDDEQFEKKKLLPYMLHVLSTVESTVVEPDWAGYLWRLHRDSTSSAAQVRPKCGKKIEDIQANMFSDSQDSDESVSEELAEDNEDIFFLEQVTHLTDCLTHKTIEGAPAHNNATGNPSTLAGFCQHLISASGLSAEVFNSSDRAVHRAVTNKFHNFKGQRWFGGAVTVLAAGQGKTPSQKAATNGLEALNDSPYGSCFPMADTLGNEAQNWLTMARDVHVRYSGHLNVIRDELSETLNPSDPNAELPKSKYHIPINYLIKALEGDGPQGGIIKNNNVEVGAHKKTQTVLALATQPAPAVQLFHKCHRDHGDRGLLKRILVTMEQGQKKVPIDHRIDTRLVSKLVEERLYGVVSLFGPPAQPKCWSMTPMAEHLYGKLTKMLEAVDDRVREHMESTQSECTAQALGSFALNHVQCFAMVSAEMRSSDVLTFARVQKNATSDYGSDSKYELMPQKKIPAEWTEAKDPVCFCGRPALAVCVTEGQAQSLGCSSGHRPEGINFLCPTNLTEEQWKHIPEDLQAELLPLEGSRYAKKTKFCSTFIRSKAVHRANTKGCQTAPYATFPKSFPKELQCECCADSGSSGFKNLAPPQSLNGTKFDEPTRINSLDLIYGMSRLPAYFKSARALSNITRGSGRLSSSVTSRFARQLGKATENGAKEKGSNQANGEAANFARRMELDKVEKVYREMGDGVLGASNLCRKLVGKNNMKTPDTERFAKNMLDGVYSLHFEKKKDLKSNNKDKGGYYSKRTHRSFVSGKIFEQEVLLTGSRNTKARRERARKQAEKIKAQLREVHDSGVSLHGIRLVDGRQDNIGDQKFSLDDEYFFNSKHGYGRCFIKKGDTRAWNLQNVMKEVRNVLLSGLGAFEIDGANMQLAIALREYGYNLGDSSELSKYCGDPKTRRQSVQNHYNQWGWMCGEDFGKLMADGKGELAKSENGRLQMDTSRNKARVLILQSIESNSVSAQIPVAGDPDLFEVEEHKDAPRSAKERELRLGICWVWAKVAACAEQKIAKEVWPTQETSKEDGEVQKLVAEEIGSLREEIKTHVGEGDAKALICRIAFGGTEAAWRIDNGVPSEPAIPETSFTRRIQQELQIIMGNICYGEQDLFNFFAEDERRPEPRTMAVILQQLENFFMQKMLRIIDEHNIDEPSRQIVIGANIFDGVILYWGGKLGENEIEKSVVETLAQRIHDQTGYGVHSNFF